MVCDGLMVDGGRAWASVRPTGPGLFVVHLDSDLMEPRHASRLKRVVGHEISHLVLAGCELTHNNEERICDLIGDILARGS